MLHDKIHIHDWVNFDHTVTKNMEIDDLKSYGREIRKGDTEGRYGRKIRKDDTEILLD